MNRSRNTACVTTLVILAAASILGGCSGTSIVSVLHLRFIEGTPIEVDTVASDDNGDGVVTGFVAEEVRVELTIEHDPFKRAEEQGSAQLTEYLVEYRLHDREGTIPSHRNGVTADVFVTSNSEVRSTLLFPIRAVSFEQKTAMGDRFAGEPVNATASLTLFGVNTDDAEDTFELEGDFDIIFANFLEPAPEGP